jgi:hypothetical protein
VDEAVISDADAERRETMMEMQVTGDGDGSIYQCVEENTRKH